jgi:hypothetical protein
MVKLANFPETVDRREDYPMKQVKQELKAIASQLEKLRKRTEEMTDRVSELAKKRGAPERPKRQDVATPTVMDQVVQVMKRHRGGVNVATLMTETGFGPTKIRNTLNRAHQQGKISRIQRGLYVAL